MNKLPVTTNNNWFNKIKLFFKNLFIKKDSKNIENNKEVEKNLSMMTKDVKIESSIEEHQNKIKIENAKKDILALIDKDSSLIYNLSIEKLSELSKMYGEDIEKLESRISYLEQKKKVNTKILPENLENQESIESLLEMIDNNPELIDTLTDEKLIKLIRLI